MNEWTPEIESMCENLRINSVNLSEYHRKRYYYFKSYSKYFRIPLIILASINSTASIGLQRFIDQQWISLTTCLIGMIIGAITSLELYLNINSNMELELKQSKDFYSLAIDLYRMLHLNIEHRGEEGVSYLNKKYSMYTKLSEASILLRRKLKVDVLIEIPKNLEDSTPIAIDSDEINKTVEKHKVYNSHYYKLKDSEDKNNNDNLDLSEFSEFSDNNVRNNNNDKNEGLSLFSKENAEDLSIDKKVNKNIIGISMISKKNKNIEQEKNHIV